MPRMRRFRGPIDPLWPFASPYCCFPSWSALPPPCSDTRQLVRTNAALMAVGTPRHHALFGAGTGPGGGSRDRRRSGFSDRDRSGLLRRAIGGAGGWSSRTCFPYRDRWSMGRSLFPPASAGLPLVLALQPDRHPGPQAAGGRAGVGQRAKHLATWALGAVALGLAVTVHTPREHGSHGLPR